MDVDQVNEFYQISWQSETIQMPHLHQGILFLRFNTCLNLVFEKKWGGGSRSINSFMFQKKSRLPCSDQSRGPSLLGRRSERAKAMKRNYEVARTKKQIPYAQTRIAGPCKNEYRSFAFAIGSYRKAYMKQENN